MIVYAHRGFHAAGLPENTLPAFRAAAERGWGIETDLRTDADGGIVLFHDRTVGDRRVDELTREELTALAGYPVPTLNDLLAADLGIPLNLEIKTTAALAAFAPYLPRLSADVLVSSFIHAIPTATAAQGVESGLLLASASIDPLPVPRPRLRTVIWDFNVASAETLAAATARGYRNIVYGPRTPAEHAFLVEAGVHAAISDTPDRV